MTICVVVASAALSALVAGEAAGSIGVGAVGSAFSKALTTSGGLAPYAYSVVSGALPTGVSLSSGGVLYGTPTGAGLTGFTIRRTDAAAQTLNVAYTLNVTSALIPTEAAGAFPVQCAAQPFARTLGTTGGVSPYSYAVVAGALPGGVTLTSGGTLSGNPTSAQPSSFTVRRTDANGNFVDTTYTQTINPQYGVGWRFTVPNTGVASRAGSPPAFPIGTTAASFVGMHTVGAVLAADYYTYAVNAPPLSSALKLHYTIAGGNTAQYDITAASNFVDAGGGSGRIDAVFTRVA